jgi:oligoribonuclease
MNLLWIDLEMSGLDVEKCRILEVGLIVTDLEFNELDSYHAIVHQPKEVLDAMDDWCTKQHGASGLTEAVAKGEKESDVEKKIIEIVKKHWKRGDRAILAGNSVGTDKLFLDKYMPDLAKHLHYRIMDVSSWKIVFENKFKKIFSKKTDAHRAVEDIRQSIAELRFYLGSINSENSKENSREA